MGNCVIAAVTGLLAEGGEELGLGQGVIVGVVVLALIVLGLWFLKIMVSRMGLMCSFCGYPRAKPIRELDEEDRAEVLSYFREYEKRSPNPNSVFVCPSCGIVCDDYSGEKHSREPDGGSPPAGQLLPEGVSGCRAFCKNCGYQMMGIAKVELPIECRHCRTVHTWQKWGDGKYTYLMPPEGTTVGPHAWMRRFGSD